MFRCIAILFAFMLLACRQPYGIGIEIVLESEQRAQAVELAYGDKHHRLLPDSSGFISFSDHTFRGQAEGMLRCGRYMLPLLLEAGKDLNVYINLTRERFGAEFYGAGAERNRALHARYRSLSSYDTTFYPRREDTLCGALAPFFSAVREDSTEVTSADFRGRYVYLCIWNTESEESVEELVFYQWLRYSLRDKPITFAAVCCGESWERWQQILREKEFRGVQLYQENDPHLMHGYAVARYPQFLLLDTAGKMLDAGVAAPSRVGTLERLKQLWPDDTPPVKDTVVLFTVKPLYREKDSILVE